MYLNIKTHTVKLDSCIAFLIFNNYLLIIFKGCESNFEVKCLNLMSLQMKQLLCIKQYVLG